MHNTPPLSFFYHQYIALVWKSSLDPDSPLYNEQSSSTLVTKDQKEDSSEPFSEPQEKPACSKKLTSISQDSLLALLPGKQHAYFLDNVLPLWDGINTDSESLDIIIKSLEHNP